MSLMDVYSPGRSPGDPSAVGLNRRKIIDRVKLDMRFARHNPMMATYRQMLFQQIIHVLRHLGMLSDKVKELMLAENLVRPEVMQHG
ncbi:hypothetical protein ACFVFQ_35470 [Streptomyces sp. NPDC057743]|uniref:hypothetical protein n=1 Tax=Streptomyces sp. NPDC057743 TaxID=3346236 RepID=UPI0036C4BC9E